MKLIDRVRNEIRVRHYSIRTETAYVGWIRQFILFHYTVQDLLGHKDVRTTMIYFPGLGLLNQHFTGLSRLSDTDVVLQDRF